MGTSQKRSSAHPGSLAERAGAYGIDWDLADGARLYEVRAKTQAAIERAHSESRPTVLEISTYRYYGHSVADANAKKYRTPEEIEDYKKNHDPINVWKQVLLDEEVIDEEGAAAIDKEAKAEADDAAKFADKSPFPEEKSILEDVYWEVDHDTEAGRTGTHFFG